MNANPNPLVTLTLPLSAVNYIVQQLVARPYAEVEKLVPDLLWQAQACVDSMTAQPSTGAA